MTFPPVTCSCGRGDTRGTVEGCDSRLMESSIFCSAHAQSLSPPVTGGKHRDHVFLLHGSPGNWGLWN